MSIIFLEGFDLYGDGLVTNEETSIMVRRELWRWYSDMKDVILFKPEGGGNAVSLEAVDESNTVAEGKEFFLGTQNFAPTNKIIIGQAFEFTGDVDMGANIGGTVQYGFPLFQVGGPDYANEFIYMVDIYRNSAGPDIDATLRFIDWGYNTIASTGNLNPNIRHYVECEIDRTAAPTVALKVWVNGGLFIDTTFAELAPRNIPWQTISVHGRKRTAPACDPVYIDDMYALDALDASQGPAFQSRLGPISIRPCPAIADSVALSEWTAFGGGDKYVEIDEQPGANDLDATHIFSSAAPQRQLFKVSTPNDLGTQILAVASFAVVKQPDPTKGIAKLSFQAREGSTDVVNEWQEPLQPLYRMGSQYYITMPEGGAFSPAAIQAGEWGVRSEPGG